MIVCVYKRIHLYSLSGTISPYLIYMKSRLFTINLFKPNVYENNKINVYTIWLNILGLFHIDLKTEFVGKTFFFYIYLHVRSSII